MKTLTATGIIGLFLVLAFGLRNNQEMSPAAAPTPVPLTKKAKTARVGDKEWGYEVLKVGEGSYLSLIANYELKANSEAMMSEHGCNFGLSAGFYGKDFKPIGAVRIGGEVLQEHTKNRVLNGYVSTNGEVMDIDYGWSLKHPTALQTGPVLFYGGKKVSLNLARDKQARRMAAVIGGRNSYFVTIYGLESLLDGPKLGDLPEVLATVGEKEAISIERAINLDGGAASAWYSPEVTLKEWMPVGSWWCVKSR